MHQVYHFAVYISMTVLGTFGNIFVFIFPLHGSYKSKHLTTADLLHVNLATGNLFNIAFRNIPALIYTGTGQCPLGDSGCQVVMLGFLVTTAVTVWNTLVLSVFRFFKLSCSLRCQRILRKVETRKKPALCILVVWSACGALFAPTAVFTRRTGPRRANSSDLRNFYGCFSHVTNKAYLYTLLSLSEIIPFLLMLAVSVATIVKLCRHKHRTEPQLRVNNWVGMPLRRAAHIHAAYLIVLLGLVFASCWGVYFVSTLIGIYMLDDVSDSLVFTVRLASMVYPTVSPYIIGLGNPKLMNRVKGCCTP
uniref:Neurotensin receptor type 1 n=2 Tax=Petromyzon marinus TaxID=7757 RepID=A0AAJ7UGM4_PETMA|nr:neurotensin receptor type 1 [Petromyzon marinus]